MDTSSRGVHFLYMCDYLLGIFVKEMVTGKEENKKFVMSKSGQKVQRMVKECTEVSHIRCQKPVQECKELSHGA